MVDENKRRKFRVMASYLRGQEKRSAIVEAKTAREAAEVAVRNGIIPIAFGRSGGRLEPVYGDHYGIPPEVAEASGTDDAAKVVFAWGIPDAPVNLLVRVEPAGEE
ncbi:MAG: hypothetical protein M0Z94_16810 [Dehalococcoidales bacterium]|nr:hypothetical protein [Dehalococcoidales bacterium]